MQTSSHPVLYQLDGLLQENSMHIELMGNSMHIVYLTNTYSLVTWLQFFHLTLSHTSPPIDFKLLTQKEYVFNLLSSNQQTVYTL